MSFFRNPNTDFSTAPFVPEDGEYLLKVTSVSARTVNVKDEEKTIISFKFTIADGEFADRKIGDDYTCWVDNADGVTNALAVVYAANGLRAGSEEADAKFKEMFPDMTTFAIEDEGDKLKLGDGWNQVRGAIVAARVVKKFVESRGRFYPNFYNFRPASEL